MRQEEKLAGARLLLDSAVAGLLLDEMEAAAINQCIQARPEDDATRAAFAAEARAIRTFRRKLALMAEDVAQGQAGAPA
ncbi:hypothetical protein [Oryzifoliimicrobium ureilyticus]|uniref:hypothetical protein n=1 Tax=Oryzifoliimicrobium ureilyticus TaxID=3113724 RepID=UPI0030767716